MKYPYFDWQADTATTIDVYPWLQKNLGLDCGAFFVTVLENSGYERPIYVDSDGIAGVPLYDDSYAVVLFYPENEEGRTITRYYFRSQKYATYAKMATG